MTNKFEFIVPHGRTTAGEAQKFTLSPDPLRPVETDDPTVAELAYMAATGRNVPARTDRPSASDILFVIALAVIVGILVAWAVR